MRKLLLSCETIESGFDQAENISYLIEIESRMRDFAFGGEAKYKKLMNLEEKDDKKIKLGFAGDFR